MTTVTMQGPLPGANYAPSSGNRYTGDANGIVYNVPVGPDINDLLNDGCFLMPSNPAGLPNLTLGGLLFESAQVGITAGTTRTQAGATILTKEVNRVDVSTAPAVGTTLGDGVLLMPAVAGLDITIINATGNIIVVYPAGTDTVNGLGAGVGV